MRKLAFTAAALLTGASLGLSLGMVDSRGPLRADAAVPTRASALFPAARDNPLSVLRAAFFDLPGRPGGGSRPDHDWAGEEVPLPPPLPWDIAPAAGPAIAPPPLPRLLPVVAPATLIFSGTARATGGLAITVSGRPVELFGVALPDSRDQCRLTAADDRSCADIAHDTLAKRLARYPVVSCRLPPSRLSPSAAICTDAGGADLGALLIANGYAVADTAVGFDYFGTEEVARSFRRGLWHYRDGATCRETAALPSAAP